LNAERNRCRDIIASQNQRALCATVTTLPSSRSRAAYRTEEEAQRRELTADDLTRAGERKQAISAGMAAATKLTPGELARAQVIHKVRSPLNGKEGRISCLLRSRAGRVHYAAERAEAAL
jgi:hypothetical protein